MATKKKASAAKSAKVTKPAAKKPAARKAVAKKNGNPFTYDASMESFKAYRDSNEFLSWRITRQTIYWSALLIYVLCLSLWVLKIQTDILDIINTIN